MKAIILLAVVGLVLAVGFAVPFNDDDVEAQDNKLKDIADELEDDYEPEDLKRYVAEPKVPHWYIKKFKLVIKYRFETRLIEKHMEVPFIVSFFHHHILYAGHEFSKRSPKDIFCYLN